MRYLRQSTATVIEVGPFVDDTDGKTLEEALTVASIDVQLMQPLDTAAVPPDRIANGAFTTDVSWTKNSWTIDTPIADVANATTVSDDLEQTPATALVENVAYELVFDVATQSAGSVTPKIGGTSGTARSTVATFTETIIAGSGALIEFTGSGFTGTIDNVVLKQVPIPITPAASGSSNDMVLTQANTGTYWLELTAAQLGIVGRHKLTAFISGALVVWEEFMVLEEAVYDDLFISGSAALAKAAALATVDTNVDDIETAVITNAAGTDIAADIIALKAETVLIVADTNELQTDNVPGLMAALNDPTVAAIADGVWNEPVAGHVGAGSFGKTDADILADTNELQADDVPGLIAALNDPTAAVIADTVWDELRAAHVIAGSFGEGVVVETNSDKTGYAIAVGGIAATSFAAGAINAAATSTDFINGIWAKICEDQGSYTAQQILSILLSACAGVTAAATFKTANGVSSRITATLNASEERTAITLAPSAGA